WTNWFEGKVNGATITLTRQSGGFLIAFLAIFVSFSGKSFWKIACFALHRFWSSESPQDGLYHQRQAALRNSETPEAGFMTLFKSLWVWNKGTANSVRRRSTHHPFRRLLPLISFAFIVYAAFGVAGILSSNIMKQTANEVLIYGDKCGPLISDPENLSYGTVLLPYMNQRAVAALNYATQCYTNNSNTADCNLFVKPQLDMSVKTNLSCPFAEDICRISDNLLMDTGFINSHDDLGINSPPQDRFSVRIVYQCSVLNLKGYDGWSYEVPLNYSIRQMTGIWGTLTLADYEILYLAAYGGTSEAAIDASDFTPIPQLRQPKSSNVDIFLFFLSGERVIFGQPSDDPLYSAHQLGHTGRFKGTNRTTQAYLLDEPASTLACTQQIQVCNPNPLKDTQCEPAGGLGDIMDGIPRLWPDNSQQNLMNWSLNVFQSGIYDLMSMVIYLGISVLTARDKLQGGFQAALPPNQWQLELEHLGSGTLASLQTAFVEAANGPPDPQLFQFQLKPNDTESRSLCNSQKVISSLHSSFRVLSLSLILSIGSILILLDFALVPCPDCFQRRRHRSRYARLEWRTNATLQLQRLAHEGIGAGVWSRADEENPVTEEAELLAVLVIEHEKHPIL
ncbi:hypothetical protein AOQ84DRAFT_246874, partial [Glonium stellatum]